MDPSRRRHDRQSPKFASSDRADILGSVEYRIGRTAFARCDRKVKPLGVLSQAFQTRILLSEKGSVNAGGLWCPNGTKAHHWPSGSHPGRTKCRSHAGVAEQEPHRSSSECSPCRAQKKELAMMMPKLTTHAICTDRVELQRSYAVRRSLLSRVGCHVRFCRERRNC